MAALLHLLAVLPWLLLALPLTCKILVLLCIAGHAAYFYRLQIIAVQATSVAGLGWDKSRGWRVYNPVKGWRPATLHTPVFIHTGLVAARFQIIGCRSCSAIIVKDRLPAEAFRRLRVRLLQSAREH